MEKASQRSPDVVFATSLMKPGSRDTAYRRWMRPIAAIQSSNDEPIDASVSLYRLGQISLARSATSAAHYVRNAETIAYGRFHDCVLLRLLVQGDLEARFGDETVAIKEGDIYLTDMAKSTELWTTDCAHINVWMPRWSVNDADISLHGRVLHREWLPCRMLKAHLLNFVEVLQYCDADMLKEMVRATMELLHVCLRADVNAYGRQGHFDEERDRIVDYIHQHLGEPDLDTSRLRRQFNVSRAQLYRQFAELGGIQHYIRNQRLQAVLRDLCSEPDKSIGEIIQRHGFSNERQFQRAFRARFGMTASQARAGWTP